jgi:hypothetical protein
MHNIGEASVLAISSVSRGYILGHSLSLAARQSRKPLWSAVISSNMRLGAVSADPCMYVVINLSREYWEGW